MHKPKIGKRLRFIYLKLEIMRKVLLQTQKHWGIIKKRYLLMSRPLVRSWIRHNLQFLIEKLAKVFFEKAITKEALRYLRQAMSYYENPFPKTQWGIRFAIISSVLKQFLFQIISGAFNWKRSKRLFDTIKERLRIYEIISWIDFYLNKERLTLNIIRALNFVEHNGYVEGIVLGLTGIGFICDTINFYGIANIYHQKSLGLLNQIDSPVAKGHCYFGVGWHEDFLGNWEKAVEYYSRSADVFWEMGDLRRWGDPTIFIAFLYNRIGEFAQGLELSKEVSRIRSTHLPFGSSLSVPLAC